MGDSNRNAFTEIEEAFFRAGEAYETEAVETFVEHDERSERKPLLRRLFARKATQA
jgi:hypothetical protein